MENAFFTVEVLVSEHKRPEEKQAKIKEIKNLEDYDIFVFPWDQYFVILICIGRVESVILTILSASNLI